MKISEIIKELTTIQEKYGDLDMYEEKFADLFYLKQFKLIYTLAVIKKRKKDIVIKKYTIKNPNALII